jgi:serine/threonine protein kinase
MFYAMLYGRLPFWGDSEDEQIEKITNAPLKFDPEVCVTDPCKEVIKAMLQKNPEKRVELIHLIQDEYFIMEDEDLEVLIEQTKVRMEQQKQEEEEKAAQKMEESILNGIAQMNLMKGLSQSSDPKMPRPSKVGAVGAAVGKDRTPMSTKRESGAFGASAGAAIGKLGSKQPMVSSGSGSKPAGSSSVKGSAGASSAKK